MSVSFAAVRFAMPAAIYPLGHIPIRIKSVFIFSAAGGSLVKYPKVFGVHGIKKVDKLARTA